jgi:hypothetical protein
MKNSRALVVAAAALTFFPLLSPVGAQQPAAPAPQLPQAPNMTFFVTGAGPGKGADLGVTGIASSWPSATALAVRRGAPI